MGQTETSARARSVILLAGALGGLWSVAACESMLSLDEYDFGASSGASGSGGAGGSPAGGSAGDSGSGATPGGMGGAIGGTGGACADGFADCTEEPGCETNIAIDPANCGVCDRACSEANVDSPSCTSGVCDSSCLSGWGNCSEPAEGPDDGCETNVTSDNDNCGGCGDNCHRGFECVLETCRCMGSQDCFGGADGTCDGSGKCVCGGVTCSYGEDCTLQNSVIVCGGDGD